MDILNHLNIITSKGKLNPKFQQILDKHPHVTEMINNSVKFIHENDTKLKLRMIVDGHNSRCGCKMCSNETKYDYQKKKFKDYCSHKCAWSDPHNVEKAKNTKLIRHGSSTYNNRDGAKRTLLDTHGVDVPAKSDEIKQRIKDTKRANGSETKATERRRSTNIERYGSITYASSKIPMDSDTMLRDAVKMHYLHHSDNMSLTGIASMLNVSVTTVSRWMQRHDIPVRFDCSFSSEGEKELSHFIKSVVGELNVVLNCRKTIPPYELDIVIPSLNIAIEFNGIYWHSEHHGQRDKWYHRRKHDMCVERGYQLIQVWSNEWYHKRNLVQSRLVSKLKHSNITIFARKCSVQRIVDPYIERNFFSNNHIQGYSPSSICYGLYHQSELVSIMSFGTSRFSSKYQYELLRFAVLQHTNIVGGAAKLFSHFIRNHSPESIVSYCMLRWNTGNVYDKLGFQFLHNSDPSYHYFNTQTNTNEIHSRVKFQKHKLSGVLSDFDPNKTEWENMLHNGYDRIWDCGNGVWVWECGD